MSATPPKIPWDKLKADTLRAICRDFGSNPGKRKREGMLEFLRAVETTGLDEAQKLHIEDKDDTSPRRPSTKRARPADDQAPSAAQAESSPEAAGGRPKRKAAPPPVSEAPVKGRGKKVKTDAAAPPVSKGKKSSNAEKKAAGKADEDAAAAREQQEADEVDALADEPAENGTAVSADQGAPEAPNANAPEPNAPAAVVIETTQVEAVITA
ncbi:hypothetical protein EI94DRAFT_1754515 [Lactarius quietus]|nr:hypothetical protein EI94DRAFT_1754515 [Lactarius quietus]